MENSIIDSSPVKWERRPNYIPYDWEDDHDTKIRMWIPEPPEESKILGYHLSKKEQKWENIKPSLPTIKGKYIESFSGLVYEKEKEYKWEIAAREEIIKQKGHDPLNPKKKFPDNFADELYFNPVMERFRKQEWERRKNGVWVFINGKKVYLPPSFYFFLAWVKIDIGTPTFMFPVLDYAMILEWVWGHPRHLGVAGIGGRGWSKTTFALGFLLEKLTRNPRNQGMALQSKTDEDGKDQYSLIVRPMFHSLPDFFKPSFNPSDTNSLRLEQNLGRSVSAVAARLFGDENEGLNNWMTYYSANEMALDGKTLTAVLNDEFAKLDKGSCFERHAVNAKCVFRPIRGKTGIIIAVSTIEKMSKKGSVEAQKLIENSKLDPDDPNKRTATGLVRFVFYADKTYMMYKDEYGYVDRKATKKIVIEEHAVAGQKSKQNMMAEMRKMPLEWGHIWIKENANNNFDINLLNNRIKELEIKNETRRVKFVEDKKKQKITWVADEDGPWEVSTLEPTGGDNKVTFRGMMVNSLGKRVPNMVPENTVFFKSGMDPVDDSIKGMADKNKMSLPALIIFEPFNPMIDSEGCLFQMEDIHSSVEQYKLNRVNWKTNKPVAMYFHRYDNPNDNYAQMSYGLRYFGCKVHAEKNKHGFINFMHMAGMKDFIMKKPRMLRLNDKNKKSEEYTSTSVQLKPTMIELVEEYIERYGHLIPFKRLCEQLKDFDVENFREYDLFISLAYVLMSLYDVQPNQEKQTIDLRDFFA